MKTILAATLFFLAPSLSQACVVINAQGYLVQDSRCTIIAPPVTNNSPHSHYIGNSFSFDYYNNNITYPPVGSSESQLINNYYNSIGVTDPLFMTSGIVINGTIIEDYTLDAAIEICGKHSSNFYSTDYDISYDNEDFRKHCSVVHQQMLIRKDSLDLQALQNLGY